MAASPYLVSTSPLDVPPGCGCCPDEGCPDICGLGVLCVHPFFEDLPADTTFDTFDVTQDTGTCDYSGTGSNTFMVQTVSTTHTTISGVVNYVFNLQLFYPSTFLSCSYHTDPIPVSDFECPSFDVSYPLYGSNPGSCFGDYTLNGTSINITNGPCIAPMSAMRAASSSAEPPPPCAYLAEDPLPIGETVRLGLSVLRQWRQCSQGYGVKGTDGNGYICGCAPWPDGGCGGCPSYVAGNNS